MAFELSSIDIYFLYKEMAQIVRAKYERCRRENSRLILNFFKPRVGKFQLIIMVPNLLYISSKTNKGETSNFTKTLDAHLKGSELLSITQPEFERIIVFEFETVKGSRKLIIELFSKGNVLLLKDDKGIISSFLKQHWGGRDLKAGTKYKFPPIQKDPTKFSENEILKLKKNSRMSNISKFIAKDLGLGGVWAEELCQLVEIDPKLELSRIKKQQLLVIIDGIKKILRHKIKPIIFYFKGEINVSPFEIKTQNTEKEFATLSDALEEISEKILEYAGGDEAELKIKRILQEQEDARRELNSQIKEYSAAGEKIYENYGELKAIIEEVRKLRKNLDGKERKKEILKIKNVNAYDDKAGKITIKI